jgi:hypothetical protein
MAVTGCAEKPAGFMEFSMAVFLENTKMNLPKTTRFAFFKFTSYFC